MAFGKHIASGGARAEQRMSQKGLDSVPIDSSVSQESGPVASVPPQASTARPQPSRPAFSRPSPSASDSAASRPAFGRPRPPARPAPGPVSQSTRPSAPTRPAPARPAAAVPAPQPAPAQAFSAPRAASDIGRVQAPAPAAVSDLFSGYSKMVESNSRRRDGLPLRLERLIDEISDFQGYSDDHRENAKLRALSDPKTWERKLSDYYVNSIRPQRARTAQTLEEARAKNPNKVVYVAVEKGSPSIKIFDRDSERGQEEAVLDGATVETVFSTRTPFLAPREVFGAADAKQELDANEVDEAFSETVSVSRSPRP